MSGALPGPIGPATTAKRGTMSPADKAKLDAYPDTPASSAVSSVTQANGLTLTGGLLALDAAGDAAAGALTAGAQNIGGAKTFSALITALSGIVTSLIRSAATVVLRSALGVLTGEYGVKVGFETLDGNVHAGAIPFAVFNGLGGVETRLAYVDATGGIHFGKSAGFGKLLGASSGGTYVLIDDTNGVRLATSGVFVELLANGQFQASTNIKSNGGDLEALTNGKGFICQSPDLTRWRITVSNAGAFVATAL